MVVAAAPTSTTNITGFFAIVRGFSLRKESTIARDKIALSASDFFRICVISEIGSMAALESLSSMHQKMFKNRPEAERRKERQRSDNQHRRNQQPAEQATSHRKGSRRFRNDLFPCKIPGDR